MKNQIKTDETTDVLVISDAVKSKAQDILLQFGLNFNISKRKLVDEQNNNSGYFGLWNDQLGICIHTVKEGYTVSQNKDIVEVALMGIAPFGDKLRVTKAGSINDGRKVFLQIGIEGDSVVGNDIVERFVTIIDSNDGSTGLSVGIGDACMRCGNQFYKFYSVGGNKFRHTATIEQKIKKIPDLISVALQESLKQIELYNQFVNTPINYDLANKLVKHILGYDRVYTSTLELSEKSTKSINIMDALYADIETEFEQVGENLWALLGGVTRYTTHSLKTPKRENGQTESLLIGRGYEMNQKALAFCTDYLNSVSKQS